MLENELEEYKRKLNKYQSELTENKLKCKLDKICSYMTVVMEIVVFLISIGIASPIRIVATMLISYLVIKGLTKYMLVSTRKERKIIDYRLKQDINELEKEISSFEKELKNMKDKTNYQLDINENTNMIIKEKISSNFLEENIKNKPKVKVKTYK